MGIDYYIFPTETGPLNYAVMKSNNTFLKHFLSRLWSFAVETWRTLNFHPVFLPLLLSWTPFVIHTWRHLEILYWKFNIIHYFRETNGWHVLSTWIWYQANCERTHRHLSYTAVVGLKRPNVLAPVNAILLFSA